MASRPNTTPQSRLNTDTCMRPFGRWALNFEHKHVEKSVASGWSGSRGLRVSPSPYTRWDPPPSDPACVDALPARRPAAPPAPGAQHTQWGGGWPGHHSCGITPAKGLRTFTFAPLRSIQTASTLPPFPPSISLHRLLENKVYSIPERIGLGGMEGGWEGRMPASCRVMLHLAAL